MDTTNSLKDGNKKILIVEDKAIIALNLKITLETNGYKVIGCISSAKAALAIAKSEKCDLATIDIKLVGDMNGITLAQQLMSKYNIPSLIISGNTENYKNQLLALHPIGCVSKPYKTDELLNTLESYFATI